MWEVAAAAYSGVWTVIQVVLLVLTIVAYWRIFEKAGEKGNHTGVFELCHL